MLLSTDFFSVRSRTIFWRFWINSSLSTTLSFWSFYILDSNYFSFRRVWSDFVEALSLFLKAWDSSLLIFLLLFQDYPHLRRNNLNFSLRAPKIVLTFPLWALWLIISSYAFTPHLLSLSEYLLEHCHVFLYGHWIYVLLLLCLIFFFHIVNRKFQPS